MIISRMSPYSATSAQKGPNMNVVLVLNRKEAQDVRVVVNLQTKTLREKVIALLEEDRCREAFELMLLKAKVIDYLPPGKKPSVRPKMILMEDLL